MASENLESLAAFLQDISCLDRLEKYTEKVNFFDVLRIAKMEIRHSNFLAWLLDPNANHRLGSRFLREFIMAVLEKKHAQAGEICRILSGDLSDFIIKREEAHIDITGCSRSLKVVFCIENKIGAGEHDAQLQRYREYIEKQYEGYDGYFVFLSPDGTDVQDERDRETWLPMDYGVICDSVRKFKDSDEATEDVRFILNQYYDILRREVMDNEEIARICKEIYEKHRAALDLIYDNIDDICRRRYDFIVGLCREYAQAGKIRFDEKNCNKRYIRFSSENLDETIFPLLADGGSSGWKNDHSAFYEIRNNEKCLSLSLAVSATGLAEDLKARAEKFARSRKSGVRDGWEWMSYKPLEKRKMDPSEVGEDVIRDCLEKGIGKLPEYERELIGEIDG